MPTIEERELEDFLMEDPAHLENILGSAPGMRVYRQFNMGSYGTADIVAVSPYVDPGTEEISVQIIELKKDEVNTDTLIQAARYRVGFLHHLKQLDPEINTYQFKFEIHLIGSRINMSDWVYLGGLLNDVYTHTYSISLKNGIKISGSGLRDLQLINPRFNSDFGAKHSEWRRLLDDQIKIHNRVWGEPPAEAETEIVEQGE